MTGAREIAERLDTLLHIAEIPDYPGALNGLQFANRGEVRRIVTAVDFSSHIIREAIAAQAQMLLVHHGMFWGGLQPVTGLTYERYASLLSHDIAVYSAHLPLDLHP